MLLHVLDVVTCDCYIKELGVVCLALGCRVVFEGIWGSYLEYKAWLDRVKGELDRVGKQECKWSVPSINSIELGADSIELRAGLDRVNLARPS
jgi:hypothetical protein